MKILITAASPWSGLDDTAVLLAQAGLQPAQPAPVGPDVFQSVGDWHTQLLQTLDLHPQGLNASAPLPVGKLWEDMAVGLLRANLGQADWFLADTRATWVLDFWGAIDPQARFLLLYLPAEAALQSARLQTLADDTAPTDTWDATACAQAWLQHNRQLLRLAQAQPQRTLLVNTQQAVLHPQRLVSTLAGALGVKPAEPGDLSQWEPPIYLTAQIEALVAPALALELRAMNRQLREAQTPLQSGGTQLVLATSAEAGTHKGTSLLGWLGKGKQTEQALAQLGHELAHTQADLGHAQDIITTLASKKERLQNQLTQVDDARRAAQAALEQAQQAAQKKSEELGQRQQALTLAQAQLQQLRTELERTQQDRQAHAQRINSLQAQLDAAQREAEQTAQQADLQQQAHSSRVAELQQEGELLLQQLHQVQEELEKFFHEREALKQQLAAAEQGRAQAEQAKAQAEKARADADKARAEADQKAATLSQQAQAAQTAQQQAEKARTAAEQGKTQAEQAKAQADKARADAEKASAEAAKALAQAQKKHTELAQQLTTLQASQPAQAQALQEAQQESALLLQQLHQVQEELEKVFHERQALQQQLTAAEQGMAQAEQAKAQADKARVDAEKARAEADQKAAALSQQAQAAQTAREQADKARAAAEQGKTQAEKARADADNARANAEKLSAEAAQALADAQKKGADLAQQLAALQASQPAQAKALQETQQENDLLLKQLHQVQEELESYFIKHQDAQQAHAATTERLNRLLQRLPTWADAAQLSAEVVAQEPDHRCLRIRAQQVWVGADAPIAQLQFLFGVRDGVPYLEFRPGPQGVPDKLLPWPAQLADENGPRLLLAPQAPGALGSTQAAVVAQLSATQWRLVRGLLVLVGSQVGRLGNAAQADRAVWAQATRQLTQQLEALSPTLHHEGVEVLAVTQPMPGLETLRVAIKQLSTKTLRMPLLVFELGLLHKTVKGQPVPQALYLEFRQWKAATPPFAGWKPNGQDAQGPFMRLNYPLKGKHRPQPPELAHLTEDDQALLASLQGVLPLVLEAERLARFTLQVPTSAWSSALQQLPFATKPESNVMDTSVVAMSVEV